MTTTLQKANSEVSKYNKESHTLEEYLDLVSENPEWAVDSVQYLLNAIEHFGTRTVIERGEEKERWRFFDDPANNGEHAVLGNTEELNNLVDSIKRKTRQEGQNNKVVWITGPTATGKSELKRCFVNGIRAYAKTEEGRRFTLEWSIDSLSEPSLTYNDHSDEDKEWFKSPVNVNPLSVLPGETREDFISSLDSDYSYDIENDIDPFSREAYSFLKEEHDSFEEAVSAEHLRVVSYIPEMGDGLGILHTEDSGNVKDRMVGSWMRESMEEFASRGRRNAQAFTYDGVLAQGNSCISLVEDSNHHVDLFQKLMNVCEENFVKLDNEIMMHLDTLIIAISNPDFEDQLNQYADKVEEDPLKALRRRLEKYEFNYITSFLLETQLLKKELTNEVVFWECDTEEQFEKASDSFEIFGTHISPHALEAAAFYNVLTRLGSNNTPLFDSEIALFYERGYHLDGTEKVHYDADEIVLDGDGEVGIPVTFTSDIISRLAQSEEDVIMPKELIVEIRNSLEEEPMFSGPESDMYRTDAGEAVEYADKQMREDVLNAMVAGHNPTEEDVENYVDWLFAWEDEREDDYEAIKIKDFETSYLGLNPHSYKDDSKPNAKVRNFRRKKIIEPIGPAVWGTKGDDEELMLRSDALEFILDDTDWPRVGQIYDNLDMSQWNEPPEGSATESLKEKTIENMVGMGYTRKSAEIASARVISVFPPNLNQGD